MINLSQIASLLDGELKGDPTVTVESVNSLDNAGEKEITFCVKENIDPQKIKERDKNDNQKE
jgi:UDP-3-O-[3-hydroxymyristoyl] glucosamine N-acyltransferase